VKRYRDEDADDDDVDAWSVCVPAERSVLAAVCVAVLAVRGGIVSPSMCISLCLTGLVSRPVSAASTEFCFSRWFTLATDKTTGNHTQMIFNI